MNEIEKRIFQNPYTYNPKELAECLSKKYKTVGLTVFRGDDRDDSIIKSQGFSPWNIMPKENLIGLIADLISDEKFRKVFWAWWKYPANRTINEKNNPFVSTGTECGHKGTYEYKIELNDFNMYEISKGILYFQVGFNGDNLENSSIIAIQIDMHEVIFGTNIPGKFIELKK